MKKHVADFFRLKCAPDLLALKVFPNVKEITASMGAFRAMDWLLKEACGLDLGNPNIALVSVGDGATPRTAALFAFRTGWMCWSIDPHARQNVAWDMKMRRLLVIGKRVEDLGRFDLAVEMERLGLRCEQVVIVLVHSHARMGDVLAHVVAPRRHVISIPCCVPHEIPNRFYFGYADKDVWSPKNTVKVWRDV